MNSLDSLLSHGSQFVMYVVYISQLMALEHEFYWLQCHLWKLAAEKLGIFQGPGVTI